MTEHFLFVSALVLCLSVLTLAKFLDDMSAAEVEE